MVLIWIIISTLVVSLISLVGVLTLAISDKLLHKLIFCFIGFSAGALIGGAFLHLLPEALQENNNPNIFYYLILGIVLFFIMERFLHWRHCHEEHCQIHPFTYLSLIGDGMHNFLDGLVIAASFVVSFKLGVVTTVAIILHEIPQELGDFAVLVYGGFSRKKALFCNFISALTALLGALIGYFLSGISGNFPVFILPFTAGGFIYIAASDLIPEIHKEKDLRRSTTAFFAFFLGILFMILAKQFLPE
ncbi:MAG: ZIP family metal transporter [Candidatus Omnitrophica bacterium]|jgi:zinc and cadmium transporter|nr:ZIP family metal transporter [Candidatus Omnitrophota bacterium]